MRIIACFLTLSLAWAQSPSTQMTLYKDGYALIKQPVQWTLNKGLNTVHVTHLPEGLLPDSPFLKLDGATVRDQWYTKDQSRGWNYLASQIDQPIEVKVTNDKVKSGTLLEFSSSTITLQDDDDIIVIPLNRIDYVTSKGILTSTDGSPDLAWRLDSQSGKTVKGYVLYLSTGFDWNAQYRMIMNEPGTSAELTVEAAIKNNSKADFTNLGLSLVEGQLNRPSKKPLESGARFLPMMKTMNKADAALPSESGLGDFHIYRLNKKYTLSAGTMLTTALYDPRKIGYQKTYEFRNSERSQKEEPLEVRVTFKNTEENHLDIPLPAGVIKMYLKTDTGLEFLGEDRLKPVPIGGTVELNGGRAFDVTGKRKVLNYNRQRKSEDASIEITITNQQKDSIQVKVIENISGDWVIRDESTMYIKEDANTIYFPVTILPESSQVITYTYRKSWN